MNKSPLLHEVTELHAGICNGLADPTRILMLYALVDAPRNVNDLTQTLRGASTSAYSIRMRVRAR